MSYNFANLNAESFQQLCQALIVKEFSNAQCLPVGQPDGGRDAFVWNVNPDTGKKELTVFQVKFSRSPQDKEERTAIEELIKSEADKVVKLKTYGLVNYYFLTNVQGTAHLNDGSIDKVDKILSASFGANAYSWWADDLSRRIDSCSDIKWSYPNILSAADFLEILITAGGGEDGRRRQNAISLTINAQFTSDYQVRFKEIDLNFPLSDLFIDTPAEIDAGPDETKQRFNRASEMTAASFLLQNQRYHKYCPLIILQGAPGQGKSTVTQYVAQVHRSLFLNRKPELIKISASLMPDSMRLPLRADLRDYAAWLEGRIAFGDNAADLRPKANDNSLEAFLAAMIYHASGGTAFNVTDLQITLQETFFVLLLDGFDEVADITTRERMVKEIELGVQRLSHVCANMQAVVTSRPSALISGPKFDPNNWITVNLLNLTPELVKHYGEKWATARKLEPADRRETLSVLQEKLKEIHVLELARNPMQLSILISLIHAQGPSLPDRRTDLYNDYIKLFFDREARKSPIVKRYRQLLIGIHEYLAYTLHSDAESVDTKSSARTTAPGTITLADLKREIRGYLTNIGHPEGLLDGLFAGIAERVVALVSRKQGTYEFPVQPLREYFAAQYLYKTASVRPGSFKGSRPQRLKAIIRRPYWSNVLRFYVGCYHVGELPSLIEEAQELDEVEDFYVHVIGREQALASLADHVFQDQPKLVERYISYIFSSKCLDALLIQAADYERVRHLALPERVGRSSAAKRARELLTGPVSRDRRRALAQIFYHNSTTEECLDLWRVFSPNMSEDEALDLALVMDVPDSLPERSLPELELMFNGENRLRALISRPEYLFRNQDSGESFIDQCMQSGTSRYLSALCRSARRPSERVENSDLGELALAVQPSIDARSVPVKSVAGMSYRELLTRYLPYFSRGEQSSVIDRFDTSKYEPILDAFRLSGNLPFAAWEESTRPASLVTEACRAIFGEAATVLSMALNSALRVKHPSLHTANLADHSYELCGRFETAMVMFQDVEWWRVQIRLSDDLSRFLILSAFFGVGRQSALQSLWPVIIPELETLDTQAFSILMSLVFGAARRAHRQDDDPTLNLSPECFSNRLAVILLLRYGTSLLKENTPFFLKALDEGDLEVAERISDFVLSSVVGKGLSWAQAKPFIEIAHRKAIVLNFYSAPSDHPLLPKKFQSSLNAETTKYPLNLLSIFNRQQRSKAEREGPSLRTVAESEDWFLENSTDEVATTD